MTIKVKIVRYIFLQGNTDETRIYACGDCIHAIPYNSLQRHAELAHGADLMEIIDTVNENDPA